MVFDSTSIYQSLVQDKKVNDIIDELNRRAHQVSEKFKKLCEDLISFEEVDNEMNRITGKYKMDGSYYISALLYYVATKGWKEPVKYLLENGADIRLIVFNDDSCTRDKISENVVHFFDMKSFMVFNY